MPFAPILLGKIKGWGKLVGGLLLALIPILAYFHGRKNGQNEERTKTLLVEVERREKQIEFIESMNDAEAENEASKPRNRDELVNSLRDQGL